MKKILSILMIICFIFVASSCDNKQNISSQITSNETTSSQIANAEIESSHTSSEENISTQTPSKENTPTQTSSKENTSTQTPSKESSSSKYISSANTTSEKVYSVETSSVATDAISSTTGRKPANKPAKVDITNNFFDAESAEKLVEKVGPGHFIIKSELAKNIVDYHFNYEMFITNDGSLYKIGKFSDGSRVKQLGEGIKFIKFFTTNGRDLYIISDNAVYRYDANNFSVYKDSDSARIFEQMANKISLKFGGNILLGYVKNHSVYYDWGGPQHDIARPNVSISDTDNEDFPLDKPAITFESTEKVIYTIDGTIKTDLHYYFLKYTVNVSQYDDIPSTSYYSFEKIKTTDNVAFFKYNTFRLGMKYISYCVVDNEGNLYVVGN